MSETPTWYIIRQENGTCEILPDSEVAALQSTAVSETTPQAQTEDLKIWGPFPDQNTAIARRVGLIRSGQCQPR